MPSPRTTSVVTTAVLFLLLAAGAGFGWYALSRPVSEDGAAPTATPAPCPSPVAVGEVLRSSAVTVSVFNAGTRSGLASEVSQQLVTRGFRAGKVANAPDELSRVRFARILAPSRKDPAAQLVARQFGKNTLVQPTKDSLGPGVDVVVGDDYVGMVKAPRRIVARAPGGGC